ncbi:MAG TPA: hypothetical protein VFH95_09580 [Candidatus Kapabacteria bacterium]|nr:hypothetical protein [Candidatus Kapabacteria bacterium]
MCSTLWKKWFAGATVVLAVLLVALLCSQHRDRLIAGSYRAVDSSARLVPGDSLRFLAPASLSDGPGFFDAVSALRTFDKTYPLRAGDALPTLDDPDTCLRLLEEGHPVHCYNVDIAAAVILANEKIPSRLWDLNGPIELGGDGHNLLEIFDGGSRHWKAIDPYYHCYFILGQDSTPISVTKLRRVLLTSPESVHLVRYSDTSGERPEKNIISELKFLAPGAMLHANNDFSWRYDHRYGWLTGVAAPLFDKLPLRTARGVRTIMLGGQDRLYVIEDRFSPHFPFTLMKGIFWMLATLFGISFIGMILTMRSRSVKHSA